MLRQRTTDVFIIFLLLLTIIIFAIYAIFLNLRTFLPLVVSIFAIVGSIVSLFREELFPFRLRVFAGDIIFLNNPSNPIVDLVLILTFINLGYVDGVIEYVALKVTNSKEQKKLYIACNEIDNRSVFNLVRQPQLQISNTVLFPFSAFPLQSRQSIKKHLAFAWSSTSEFTNWEVEHYKFEVYLKLSHWNKLKKVSEFTHDMSFSDFKTYASQESYYMAGVLERSIIKQVNQL
jgi:hypothetical protein